MILHTTSEIISLARSLENESAEFYKELSHKYTKGEGVLLSFAEENKKNIIQFERAYYGVISDAIEGCFAFNLEADDYILEASLDQNAGLSDALNKAIKIESKITQFYSDAAEQSQALMADVPRVFKLIARKREERRPKLEALLKEKD